jgi:protease IV
MTTADIERIFDREKLRKSRRRWRIIGVVAIIAALGLAIAMFATRPNTDNQIARIRIDGMITGDERTMQLIEDIEKADHVKAVVMRINSPGGTTVGSEAVYEALRRVAEKKPVVAVMDSVAASGGYIAALSADHIVARGNTMTGSIGVVFSYPEVSKLMETLGIRFEEIKSGELKAEPTPFKPLSEKVRSVSNAMVQDSFNWFVGLVAERRKMTDQRVRVLADGRVYTGRQAKTEGLIDALGGEEVALTWLTSAKSIPDDLEVIDWRPKRVRSGFGYEMGSGFADAIGLTPISELAERSKLDGLLVLWHPSLTANHPD